MNGPVVAILPLGDVVEDWIDDLGLTADDFMTRMSHGWMYGFSEALRRAGGRGVVVCVSDRVRKPRRIEVPGAPGPIWLLPQPAPARLIRRLTIRSRRLPARAFNAPLRRLRPYVSTPLRRLPQVLRSEHCTAMLCQEYEYARSHVCVAVGRAIGIPVFLKFGGMTAPAFRLVALTRRWAMRHAAGFVIAAADEERRTRERYGVAAERIARIGMPIDVDRWSAAPRDEARARLGVPRDALVVAWHGRVEVHIKGLDLLLEAWAQVARASGRRLHLLGAGRESEELRRLIDAYGGGTVFWQNEFSCDTEAIRDFLSAADIYALTSRWEGQSLSVLEAMACGLPVLATTTARSADVLRLADGRCAGLEVPANAAAIADGLERLLADATLRREAGAAARQRIEEEFSTEVIGRRLVSFLQERSS
jgi:glycosyltransferase involved in cell wall biosynthesis